MVPDPPDSSAPGGAREGSDSGFSPVYPDLGQPRVCVVIVTYTAQERLERCLASLGVTSGPRHDVVVVDNGSTFSADRLVAQKWPAYRCLVKTQNEGFTGGVNAGLKFAMARGYDYVAVLNDDTQIVDSRWLDSGVVALGKDSDLGLVGFEMVDPSESLTLPAQPVFKDQRFINGFAILYRTKALERVGVYDETYFAYGDEDDLLARVRAAGFRTTVSSIPVGHEGGVTTGSTSVGAASLQMRNSLRYALKHRGWVGTILKLIRLIDVAVSPFPLLYRKEDVSHVRMREAAGRWASAGMLWRAVLWNLVHASETRKVAQIERSLARRPIRAEDREAIRFRGGRPVRHLPMRSTKAGKKA